MCYAYSWHSVGVLDETGSTAKKTYPNSYSFNMTEGFGWNRVDSNGYYNLSSEQAISPEILLIGSSHMEAEQIPMSRSLGSLLNRRYKTYNIGVSAHPIAVCISHLEAACKTYRPSKYVIIEMESSLPDLTTMERIVNRTETPEDPMPVYNALPNPIAEIYRYVRTYLPAVMEIRSGLSNWKAAGNSKADSQMVTHISPSEEYVDCLNQLISGASQTVSDNNAKLIIFAHGIGDIDPNGDFFVDERDRENISLISRVCEHNGVIFVDMTEPFQELYMEKHKLPHGFSNSAVGSGHLNKDGHAVIAETLLEIIEEQEEGI